MRKLFYVTMLLVICGAVGLYFLARTGTQLDASSRSYTQQAVIAIAKDWNKDGPIAKQNAS